MFGRNWATKYGNTKLDTPSGKFDSRLEYQHYLDLQMLQRAGKITRLNRQVRIKLGKSPNCKVHYVADFAYYDFEKDSWIIADTKGFETADFKLKLKWLLDSYSNFVFYLIFKRETKIYEPFFDISVNPPISDIIAEHEKKHRNG